MHAIAIELNNIGVKYNVRFVIDGKTHAEEKWALHTLSCSIKKGECVAVLGENGSGKSTLLRLLSGIIASDQGNMSINGKTSALLSLGAGFNPEMTGRDNIYLKASLMGMSHKSITAQLPEIIAFASLGTYIHAPMKYYSDGMIVRLGFAVAIATDPDILLVDDCFSVGDIYFQRKCVEKMLLMKNLGKTIIFVSHDLSTTSFFCERALLLCNGALLHDGPTSHVIAHYLELIGEKKGIARLSNGPLAIIFNNGKIFANYNNLPLFKGLGAWASLVLKNQWFHTYEAAWDIIELTPDTIKAAGTAVNAPFSYHITVHLMSSETLSITCAIPETIAFERLCLRTMVAEYYTRWATEKDTGTFSEQFCPGKEWLDIPFKDQHTPFILLYDEQTARENIPCIAYEVSHPDESTTHHVCTLNNSGSDFRTHIIGQQTFSWGKSASHVQNKLSFLPQTTDIQTIINNYREKKSTDDESLFPITHESFFLTIIFKDTPALEHIRITPDNKENYILNGHALVTVGEETLPLHFIVKKISSCRYHWFLCLEKNLSRQIARLEITFLLNPVYTCWYTETLKGPVYPLSHHDEVWFDYFRCYEGFYNITQVRLDTASEPALLFSIPASSRGWISFFNSDRFLNKHALRVTLPEPHTSEKIEGMIYASNEAYNVYEHQKEQKSITAGALCLHAGDGKTQLWHDTTLMTKGLHFYCSFKTPQRWIDTYQFFWNAIKRDAHTLILHGQPLNYPAPRPFSFSITFTFTLIHKNHIGWHIQFDGLNDETISECQANIMLNAEYDFWSAPGKENGRFSHFLDTWQVQASFDTHTPMGLMSTNHHLPSIECLYEDGWQDGSWSCVNTDNIYKSRVLCFSAPYNAQQHEKPFLKSSITVCI